MTSAAYGTNVSAIANNNVTNFLGSANSNYAPMGSYPHINNCNIALDIIDNIKPGKFGTDEAYRKTRRGLKYFFCVHGLITWFQINLEMYRCCLLPGVRIMEFIIFLKQNWKTFINK